MVRFHAKNEQKGLHTLVLRGSESVVSYCAENEQREQKEPTSISPVHRGGDRVVGSQLEGVNHAENLIEVTAGRGGVQKGKLELLVGADDKDRAAAGHCT